MKLKLTERTVARLKPPASGKLDVWDQTLPAFGIQLRSTGRRAWIIAVRRPGKSTTSRIKIGDPATMSLADAQARARELMRDLSALEAKDDDKDGPHELTADSPMAEVIAEFIERDQKPRNRSWHAVQKLLRYDLSVWNHRPLSSITRSDVQRVIDGVLDRGKPIMANQLLAHTKRMFNWAVERDLIGTSPAAKVKPPSPKVERERVLTDPEIYEVWHGADRLGWPFGPLVQLLMLTAQREGEIAAMRWSDLDLDKGIWALPSKSTKAGRPHLVPLSTAAIGIIKAEPRLSEYVFPGTPYRRLAPGVRLQQGQGAARQDLRRRLLAVS
jgi:integrase